MDQDAFIPSDGIEVKQHNENAKLPADDEVQI